LKGFTDHRCSADELLLHAVSVDNADTVQSLLHAGLCNVNKRISGRHSPLSASYTPVVINLLLNAKADVNLPGSVSVLKASCEKLRPDAVKTLLDAGANVLGEYEGYSSLLYTIWAKCSDEIVHDKVEIINLLLDAGAGQIRPCEGFTALTACIYSHPEINREVTMKAILQHEPRLLECREGTGVTPLMSAITMLNRRETVVKTLIDAGANMNVLDEHGLPLLHRLVGDGVNPRQNTRRVLRMLLAAGADATLCDETGVSVLMHMFQVKIYKPANLSRGFNGGLDRLPDHVICAFVSDIADSIISRLM
jgi:ankyrin repeat protein